jgi:hypothetical protein
LGLAISWAEQAWLSRHGARHAPAVRAETPLPLTLTLSPRAGRGDLLRLEPEWLRTPDRALRRLLYSGTAGSRNPRYAGTPMPRRDLGDVAPFRWQRNQTQINRPARSPCPPVDTRHHDAVPSPALTWRGFSCPQRDKELPWSRYGLASALPH